MKTYPLSLQQLNYLANAICLLDSIKHFVPDDSLEKPEAIITVRRCHTLIENVLGGDAVHVYGRETDEVQA